MKYAKSLKLDDKVNLVPMTFRKADVTPDVRTESKAIQESRDEVVDKIEEAFTIVPVPNQKSRLDRVSGRYLFTEMGEPLFQVRYPNGRVCSHIFESLNKAEEFIEAVVSAIRDRKRDDHTCSKKSIQESSTKEMPDLGQSFKYIKTKDGFELKGHHIRQIPSIHQWSVDHFSSKGVMELSDDAWVALKDGEYYITGHAVGTPANPELIAMANGLKHLYPGISVASKEIGDKIRKEKKQADGRHIESTLAGLK